MNLDSFSVNIINSRASAQTFTNGVNLKKRKVKKGGGGDKDPNATHSDITEPSVRTAGGGRTESQRTEEKAESTRAERVTTRHTALCCRQETRLEEEDSGRETGQGTETEAPCGTRQREAESPPAFLATPTSEHER